MLGGDFLIHFIYCDFDIYL